MLKRLLLLLKNIQHSNFLSGKFAKILENRILLYFVFQNKNISIPLMRQLALRKINLVEILLDIFHLVITEKKLKNVGEASFHEFVEEFIIEDDATEQVIQNI